MALQPLFTITGLNLQATPLVQSPGDTLVALNVDFDPIGGVRKRAGVSAFLGMPDTSKITNLFSFTTSNGTAPTLYRSSGTSVWYSSQGTAAWTAAANGAIASGGTVRNGILNDVMLVGDGVGSTRHTTNGTSFTNTTLAPIATDFIDYQQRMYAVGTASDLFFSTTSDATNWNTAGTSDSSSLNIPGAGKLIRAIKLSDRIQTHKTSGIMHRWDGYALVDMSNRLGMSSPQSFAQVENLGIYGNRTGVYTTAGDDPKLISRVIQSQIFNDAGSAVAGTQFPIMAGGEHQYKYFLSLGTITDDLVQKTINDAVLVYDFLDNSFSNYQYPFLPSAYHSYVDYQGNQQLIMGDASGQAYQMSGTATSDNGTAIYAELQGVYHGGTLLDKQWNHFRASFNPGCQAHLSIAISDGFRLPSDSRAWVPLGDLQAGVVDYRFPVGSRGKFLFWKIADNSTTTRFICHGFEIDADVISQSS